MNFYVVYLSKRCELIVTEINQFRSLGAGDLEKKHPFFKSIGHYLTEANSPLDAAQNFIENLTAQSLGLK